MSARERVALVTPRPDRRDRAERWTRLLESRADYRLCESPQEDAARGADLVVVDAACPGLDEWITQETAGGRSPETIVVFGAGEASRGAAIGWGREGTDVLATISDFLDRRDLLREADEFLRELRDSNERLEEHRRRFAGLVAEQAEALRGANASLVREVAELTRVRDLARFFAAPGAGETFADRLAETLGGVLDGEGVALCRAAPEGWRVEGRWRISRRNALGIAPGEGEASGRMARRPSTRKGRDGWWIPVGAGSRPDTGIALLMRTGERPGGENGTVFVDSVRSLVAEGLEKRASTEALLFRKSQSERILQTLRGGLLKIDGEGRIALANPACAEILETTVEELEGRRMEEVFPAHAREILAGVPSGEGFLDDVETWVTTASGRFASVSLRASAFHGSGSGDEILVLLSDLSRRKEVEEEVRKADRLAALGRLSAGVAHEIRNPLAGIRTTAELLRGRIGSDADLVQFVDVILEETARLDRIVGSLLQFAKPSEPRPEPLDVFALLERAARLAAGRAADRRVAIRVAPAVHLPSTLADRDQILQVLLNLLLNGIEATPEGGEVRASADASADGREVRITVEDEGPGVAPAARERIFDPFFTTKPGGTGLGLSISQNIVARHGGQLRIESAGRGTRATVALPAAASAARTGWGGRSWPTS